MVRPFRQASVTHDSSIKEAAPSVPIGGKNELKLRPRKNRFWYLFILCFSLKFSRPLGWVERTAEFQTILCLFVFVFDDDLGKSSTVDNEGIQ